MEKVEKKYKQEEISFHVKYLFYPYDSLKKVTDSMQAACSLSHGQYYYKVINGGKEYEYVRNTKYFCIVDHVEKVIAVKKSSESGSQLWDINKMDSIIHSPFMKISYKEIGNNEGEYDMKLTEGVWTNISLVFNKTNYTIISMSMSSTRKGNMYGQNFNHPKISMVYTKYNTATIDESLFNDAKFFSESTAGVTTLTEMYKKYKLLNYLQKRS
ncbi:MAG TPA: hypothetical protein VK783_00830 [Bacteroidia bacterium]|nr:hypothetical protein [Bacteroidia bacterium]